MPTLFKFLMHRLLAIPITLVLITAVLYGIIMLAPVEARAELYMPRGGSNNPHLKPEVLRGRIIEQHGLNDPYPLQYARWLKRLVQGNWGWSPGFRSDVLPALLKRTPATVELTLYSVLLLIPLGILGGGIAGSQQNRAADHIFRGLAFLATAIPSFILAFLLLAMFYVSIQWFPPGRLAMAEEFIIKSESFKQYTGLLTIDGLLNQRPDISLSALRHLVLPCFTLSMVHWATLGRMTRATLIEELASDYITVAKSKGLRQRHLVWRHALPNAILPALNSIALSAASLVMGVFVVEVVFNFPGVSELIVGSMQGTPDTPAAMGFAVYSVLLVLPLMLALDILQAVFDPRLREGLDQ